MTTLTPKHTVSQPLATGFCYPKVPRWRESLLWFSDQHDGHVRALDAQGRVVEQFAVPGRPSGLVWLPNGDLLIVSMGAAIRTAQHAGIGIGAFDPHLVDDLAAGGDAQHRLRQRYRRPDMTLGIEADAIGGLPAEISPDPTCIARVDLNGQVVAVADDLSCPNGTVISADGTTLVVAETFAMRITAFAMAADGRLAQPLYICCAPDHDAAITRARRGGRIDTARVAVPGAGSP